MSQTLKLAFIQSELFWEDPEKNRKQFHDKILAITEQVDIIVLPEMFTSGFTMNAEKVAESMTGETIKWMQDLAKSKDSAITGSLVVHENEKSYNRLLFVFPDGTIEHYDKKHTFTLAGEHNVYQAGKHRLSVNYKDWKICPLICYDLRFPVWARNTTDYDVLLYVANWPKIRIAAWNTLLKARAIENMSYCIGVNRVGLDGNGHEYCGHSAAYDVLGNRFDDMPEEKEGISIVTLEKSHIETYRNKLSFLKDADKFTLG